MKKYSMILAAAFVAFASCTKEAAPELTPANELSFSATASDCAKTVLADNVKTLWTPGDEISVFDGVANNKFTTNIAENAAVAQFDGTAASAEEYYALYPYNAAASLSGNAISTTLPAAQTAVEGNYDSAAALLVAKTSTNALNFSPVASFLKITTSEAVASIKVTANAGENLAGDCVLSVAETIGVTGGSAATAELGGESALQAGTYYVAVLPATYTKGLTVTLVSESGAVILKNSSASMTLAAGTIYNMGTIEGAWSSAITSTPAALYLHGSATEGDQQMRKEGDKFVIYNTIKAGKLNFTDGDGNNYYIAGSTLVKGEGATVMDAREKVTRITVDFASKTVSYDKINDKVWIQNAWDGTVTGELSYQSKGKWSGFSSTLPIAANGDERFSFRVEINGVNTRWGSNRGNYGDFTNGTAAFYQLYETAWDQWNNLYKIFKGFKNVELTYDIEGNNLDFMRFRISVRGDHEMTLEGDGLEIYSRPFRKAAEDKYVIYTKVYGSDVKYVYNGQEHALTIPEDKKGEVVRVTVTPSTGTVTYDKVNSWVWCKFACNYYDIAGCEYRGCGKFVAENKSVVFVDPNNAASNPPSWLGWVEDRYYFIPNVNGDNVCWGMADGAVNNDGKYNGDESFWNVDEFSWDQWSHCWKFDGSLNGANVDFEINTNNAGKFTHSVTKR